VDDLVDIGGTVQTLRQLMPKAHFAAVYGKPLWPAAARHIRQRDEPRHLGLLPVRKRPNATHDYPSREKRRAVIRLLDPLA
jgi:adenine/guanine phosphoribosyltransferase-like PRPP-binding protein